MQVKDSKYKKPSLEMIGRSLIQCLQKHGCKYVYSAQMFTETATSQTTLFNGMVVTSEFLRTDITAHAIDLSKILVYSIDYLSSNYPDLDYLARGVLAEYNGELPDGWKLPS